MCRRAEKPLRGCALRKSGTGQQNKEPPMAKQISICELPQIVQTIRKKPSVVEDIKF